MTDTLEILLDEEEDDEPQVTGFGPVTTQRHGGMAPTSHGVTPTSHGVASTAFAPQLSPSSKSTSSSSSSVKQAKVTPFSHRPAMIHVDIPTHNSRFPPSSVDPASVNPTTAFSSYDVLACSPPYNSRKVAASSSFALASSFPSSSYPAPSFSRERPKALLPFQRMSQQSSKRTVAKKSTGRPTQTASSVAGKVSFK